MADNHDAHGAEGGGGHGHGHGSPFIQHHYDDAKHQFDSGKLGIWFFLTQEILFFSALFVAYILFRAHRPEIFRYAHHYLDVKWGAINTGVLIVSSLTAAWAVRAAQLNQRRILIGCLATTIVCAFGFLGIKYIEYTHKVHEGILFGKKFDPCISSGGAHLITKKNMCEGTKASACSPGDIDQRPDEPGWQVACVAYEVHVKYDMVQGTEDKVTKDPKTGAETTTQVPVTKEQKTEVSRSELPVCQMVSHGAHGPPHPENPPCWEIAQNPNVCKPDEVAALVHYPDEEKRGREVEIDLQCDPAPKATDQGDIFASTSDSGHRFGKPTFVSQSKPSKHVLEMLEAMGPPPEHTNMFFSIYFAMTGLHGIHVLFGIFVFIWLLIRAIKGHFTPEYFGPIDYAALYWHLVDLIWIYLFPLLYLV